MSFRQFKKDIRKKQKAAEEKKRENALLLTFEKRAAEFEARRNEYVQDAKSAYKSGDTSAYRSAVALIKNIMFQKAQIDDMITNFKMARDLRDMGTLRGDFSKTISAVMRDVEKTNKKINFKATEKGFASGVRQTQDAAVKLRALLSANGAVFADYADSVSQIDEKEIKYIIETEIGKDEMNLDARFDALEAELKMSKSDMRPAPEKKSELIAEPPSPPAEAPGENK